MSGALDLKHGRGAIKFENADSVVLLSTVSSGAITAEAIDDAAEAVFVNYGSPDHIVMAATILATMVRIQHEAEVRERAHQRWLRSLKPWQRWLYDQWQEVRGGYARVRSRLYWRLRALRWREHDDDWY